MLLHHEANSEALKEFISDCECESKTWLEDDGVSTCMKGKYCSLHIHHNCVPGLLQLMVDWELPFAAQNYVMAHPHLMVSASILRLLGHHKLNAGHICQVANVIDWNQGLPASVVLPKIGAIVDENMRHYWKVLADERATFKDHSPGTLLEFM